MKHLFLIVVIMCFGYSSQAQNAINNSNCIVQFRSVCLNTGGSPNCTITTTGPWTTLIAGATSPLAGCAGAGTAFEVRYAPGGPCGSFPATIVYKGPPVCTPYNPSSPMGGPCNCSSNPFGVIVDFTTTNLVFN